MTDEIPSYNPDVPAYLTEEESRVIAMLAKKMICPECDSPAELKLKASMSQTIKHRKTIIAETIIPKSLTWNCTNSNCDQSK